MTVRAAKGQSYAQKMNRKTGSKAQNRLFKTHKVFLRCCFSWSDPDNLHEETDLAYYTYRYLKVMTGRWLSRDPIGEEGGPLLYGFVANHPADAHDRLGNRCCLTWYHAGLPWSVTGHSTLKCDNGAYVSLHLMEDTPLDQWHTEEEDRADYDSPAPGAQRDTKCFDCLDEPKVSQWITDQKAAGRRWTLIENCADTTLEAIAAALPDQPKPVCPCVSADLALRGCRNYARNILEELPNGTSPLIVVPGDAYHRLEALVDNGCNKWKCTLTCIKFQFP
jgi:RHS repeat-associated protein